MASRDDALVFVALKKIHQKQYYSFEAHDFNKICSRNNTFNTGFPKNYEQNNLMLKLSYITQKYIAIPLMNYLKIDSIGI